MAYDEGLADRIRDHLSGHPAVTERRMFGGIAFMVAGNMAVGVSGSELMVRVDPSEHDDLLRLDEVRVFDLSGRPMKGWLLVGAAVTGGDAGLSEWIERGVDYAGSMPPK
jgi:hypothetical protein